MPGLVYKNRLMIGQALTASLASPTNPLCEEG
jgi:hypothetical protein